MFVSQPASDHHPRLVCKIIVNRWGDYLPLSATNSIQILTTRHNIKMCPKVGMPLCEWNKKKKLAEDPWGKEDDNDWLLCGRSRNFKMHVCTMNIYGKLYAGNKINVSLKKCKFSQSIYAAPVVLFYCPRLRLMAWHTVPPTTPKCQRMVYEHLKGVSGYWLIIKHRSGTRRIKPCNWVLKPFMVIYKATTRRWHRLFLVINLQLILSKPLYLPPTTDQQRETEYMARSIVTTFSIKLSIDLQILT